MIDTSKLVEFFTLNPRQFSVLKAITISQGNSVTGVYEQHVSLVLVKATDDDSESLCLEFHGVQKLQISQPDASVVTIHLNILDGSTVPDRDCVFFVRDAELDRVICFECRDFEAFTA